MRRDITKPQPRSGADDFADAIMTLRELADYLKCHFMTLYKLIKTAGLPAFRVGSDWRVRRADLDEWIARQHARAAESGQPKGRDLTTAKAKNPTLRKKRSRK